jgi:hypothetical protein
LQAKTSQKIPFARAGEKGDRGDGRFAKWAKLQSKWWILSRVLEPPVRARKDRRLKLADI